MLTYIIRTDFEYNGNFILSNWSFINFIIFVVFVSKTFQNSVFVFVIIENTAWNIIKWLILHKIIFTKPSMSYRTNLIKIFIKNNELLVFGENTCSGFIRTYK